MNTQLLAFILGAVFSLGITLLTSRLAMARERLRETWIRELNCYENFYRASAGLIDLLRSGVPIPETVLWAAIGDARKAAYDADLYESDGLQRADKMKSITLRLLQAAQHGTEDGQDLRALRTEAAEILLEFRKRLDRDRQKSRLLLVRG